MGEGSELVPTGRIVPKSHQTAAIARNTRMSAGGYVPHLSIDEVLRLVQAVKDTSKAKYQTRNALLVKTLFDGCLRCSEALSIRPMDIVETPDDCRVRILGKGNKYREVAISRSLVADLHSYAGVAGISKSGHFWPIKRRRVHQMIARAMEYAGIRKPDHVGAVHLMRHTGAIERMKVTGNPKSVQDQLGHSDAGMTLRYMKTLQRDESLKIQGEVDFRW